jgi:anti-anti-sigma factor
MNTGISASERKAVQLSGRFDFSMLRAFKAMYEPLLNDKAVRVIEVNLARVEYIDSTALGMLLTLREKAKDAQKRVILSHCTGTPRDVLEVASFGKLFEIQ